MINHLDQLLRHLLITHLDDINVAAQVRFRPPDEEWRNEVVNLQDVALNVYLVDLRENRKLRSNERVRIDQPNGQAIQQPAPARLDCHYLISAWSPAQPDLEPALDEHDLLYRAAAALLNNAPLNPTRLYGPNSPVLPTLPDAIREADLPAQILPVEGFLKLAEFWGTMGAGHRWKPALYLVVTLPVVMLPPPGAPVVTSLLTGTEQRNGASTSEMKIQIKGQVWRPGPALLLAAGSATVLGLNVPGTTVTVDNAAPFRGGDTIADAGGAARATLTRVQGNNLILAAPLAGLAPGATVRIADVIPAQRTFRLTGATGVAANQPALLAGEDAANPGAAVSERVVVETVNASTGFVTLAFNPLRTRPVSLDPAAAMPPALTPLQAAAGAWVQLQDNQGTVLHTVTAGDDGRFQFQNLRPGPYALRVRVPGFAEVNSAIEVPAPAGNYDVNVV